MRRIEFFCICIIIFIYQHLKVFNGGKILIISRSIVYDESKAYFKVLEHLPYASFTFNNSDEIRIPVQSQDHCLLPSKNSIHIQGKLVNVDGTSVHQVMQIHD